MKREQREHLKLRKHIESYSKNHFKDMMKRWKKRHYAENVIESYSSRKTRILLGYDEDGKRMLEVIPVKISRFDWIDHKWLVEGDEADAANVAFQYLLLEQLVRNDKPALRWMRERAMTFKAKNGETMADFKDFGKRYTKALIYSFHLKDGIDAYTNRRIHCAYGYNDEGEKVIDCVCGGRMGDCIVEDGEIAEPWLWEYETILNCFGKDKTGRKWFNRNVRTFNFKDMNFGDCIDKADGEWEERIRKKREKQKKRK